MIVRPGGQAVWSAWAPETASPAAQHSSMAAANHPNTPSQLGIPLCNRSATSLTSEAATFHSAQVIPATEIEPGKPVVPRGTNEPGDTTPKMMSRTDSGYEAGHGRRSTSTSSSRSRRHRPVASSASGRAAKRPPRSATSSTHRTISRPQFHTRHNTVPRAHDPSGDAQPYHHQFFHFPSLGPSITTDSSSSTRPESQTRDVPPVDDHPHPLPPPATVHYFLLPETRRLEYAAIDAASRGVRGFVTKLLPDCILPAEFRRTRFHNDGDEADSDAGSVRRYRIQLPEAEEKTALASSSLAGDPKPRRGEAGMNEEGAPRRPGLWRRVTGLGRA